MAAAAAEAFGSVAVGTKFGLFALFFTFVAVLNIFKYFQAFLDVFVFF